MKKILGYFLVIAFAYLGQISFSFAQYEQNSISRDELKKVIHLIRESGLDNGFCDWRGLDSDIYLPTNERFDLDKTTSIYKIHCFAGANHSKFQFFTLFKEYDEVKAKDRIYLMEFSYPIVSGEGPNSLEGMGITNFLSNSYYVESDKELRASSSYRAGDCFTRVIYKLNYIPEENFLPEFVLREFRVDSIPNKTSAPNYVYSFSPEPEKIPSEPQPIENLDRFSFLDETTEIINYETKNLCTRPYEEGMTPQLGYEDNPVEWSMIDSSGTFAQIIDYSHFVCIDGFNDYSGSTGSPLKIVINDKVHDFGLVRSWDIVRFKHKTPVLLVSLHGLSCDRTGYRSCIKAFVYEEGEFISTSAYK